MAGPILLTSLARQARHVYYPSPALAPATPARYWPSKGPQMTLYVPGPVLREGKNEVVLLELELRGEDVHGRNGKPQGLCHMSGMRCFLFGHLHCCTLATLCNYMWIG